MIEQRLCYKSGKLRDPGRHCLGAGAWGVPEVRFEGAHLPDLIAAKRKP